MPIWTSNVPEIGIQMKTSDKPEVRSGGDISLDDDHESAQVDRRDSSGSAFALLGEGVMLENSLDEHDGETGKSNVLQTLLLTLSFIVCFLDRTCIFSEEPLSIRPLLTKADVGYAQIAGLGSSLNFEEGEYEWLGLAPQVTQICFAWTSLIWTTKQPHVILIMIMVSRGFLACLQSTVSNFEGLLVLRILMGMGNATLVGIPIYLCRICTRDQLGLHLAIFLSGVPLATSFASIISWTVTKAGEMSSINTWHFIFLADGIPPIILGLIAWKIGPLGPDTPPNILKNDHFKGMRQGQYATMSSVLTIITTIFRHFYDTIADHKSCLAAFMFLCTDMTGGAIPGLMRFGNDKAFAEIPYFFLSTVYEMSSSAFTSQLLLAPPYLASAVAVLVTGYVSDRWQNQSLFITFHALLSTFGLGFVTLARLEGWSPSLQYSLGFVPTFVGLYSANAMILTWAMGNKDTLFDKAVVFVMLQLTGQLGSLFTPEGVHPYFRNDPSSMRALSICTVLMVLVALLSPLTRLPSRTHNHQFGLLERASGDDDALGAFEI